MTRAAGRTIWRWAGPLSQPDLKDDMTDDSSQPVNETPPDAPDPDTPSPDTPGPDTPGPDTPGPDTPGTGSETSAESADPSPRTRLLVTAAAGVAAVVALVCAVIFGMHGYDVYVNQKPTQTAREDSRIGAENAIVNITTIDPANVKDWQRRIDSSLTGAARSQITPNDFKALTQQIESAGTGQVATLSSRVLRSAPVEVNADEGTARVLVYVEATSKKTGEAGVKRSMGFMVGMTKKGDVWKASSIASLDSLALETDITNAGQDQTGTTATPQPSTTQGAGN